MTEWISIGRALDQLAAEYAKNSGDDLPTARAGAKVTMLAKLKAPGASIARPAVESASGYYLSTKQEGERGFEDYGRPGSTIPPIFWRVVSDIGPNMETEDWRGGNFKFSGTDRHGFMCIGYAYDVQVPRAWLTGEHEDAASRPQQAQVAMPRPKRLPNPKLTEWWNSIHRDRVEYDLWKEIQGLYPDYHISRQRVRDLIAAEPKKRGRGRRPNSPE
jgi:hypothetical protein